MLLLTPDFTANGIAILSDSHELPVQEGELTQGINGTVRFSQMSYVRHLTVQVRSKARLLNFLGQLAHTDGGLVSYEGKEYYYDEVGAPQVWGGCGSLDTNTVWEFDLTLHRPYENDADGPT